MRIERGDGTYFAPDEPVSGGISSGQPSDDVEEEKDVYSAFSDEQVKEIMEKIERMGRLEMANDIPFMKFLLGEAIVEAADMKIRVGEGSRFLSEESNKRRQNEVLFWVDLINKVPLEKAIRRSKEVESEFLHKTGTINFITKSLQNEIEKPSEMKLKELAAFGRRATIEEGMAYALFGSEKQMSKGEVLTDQQIDKLDKLRKISLEERDSIKDLIPEEKE